MATLQWNLSGTTGYDFVDHILERVPWGRENLHIRQHALTLVSVCQTGKNFHLIKISHIFVLRLTSFIILELLRKFLFQISKFTP